MKFYVCTVGIGTIFGAVFDKEMPLLIKFVVYEGKRGNFRCKMEQVKTCQSTEQTDNNKIKEFLNLSTLFSLLLFAPF